MTAVAAQRWRLATEEIELVVLPGYGARLHRLRVFGHDLLRTPDDVHEHGRDPFFWGAFNMMPWCNRIAAGPLQVGRRLVDLKPSFRDGSAIHGQVYIRPWQQVDNDRFLARGGGDGWPWPYEASLSVSAEAARLTLEQRLVNLADEPMPAGLGLHPWFRVPAQVAIRAATVYRRNTDSPVRPEPVGGSHDLRRMGEMPAGLDATWSDLDEPPVELYWPSTRLAATMTSSVAALHITAASPREIDGLALEPQSHAPQGLRRLINGEPGALSWLQPGDALSQVIDIEFIVNRAADEGVPQP